VSVKYTGISEPSSSVSWPSQAHSQHRDGEQGAMFNSAVVGAPRQAMEKDPPPYGAQYCQDALWEGGNEALPPQWFQYKMLNDRIGYQDDTLVVASWNRPLPGVRLDYTGQLVPGCEWHISPLGRSYFVNHNTRSTSWKKPAPERPPESLMPERVIEGHSKLIWSLVCLGTSCNMLSTSGDGSIRQWTRDGEPVGRPWTSDGRPVDSMAMSPDESMVVSGSADGRLRLWNIKRGSMVGNPWEGHDDAVLCLDWSSNAQEVASGSKDGTIRRWSPDTGREIAPPIETGRGRVWAVRYSPQGDKFASSGEDKVIRVWSKIGELLMEIRGHEREVTSLCWSKDGANIFSTSYDDTIRKLRSIDGKELVVFQRHTNAVHSLCLSPDESHLVTAAADCSVRIWDLETNRPVGNPLLHDDEIFAVIISPDGKYIANAGLGGNIYVWSLDAVLKHIGDDHSANESNTKHNAKLKGRAARPRDAILHVGQVSKQQHDNKLRDLARYGKDFWDADTNTGPRSTAPPARPLSSLWRNLLGSLRFGTRPPNAPQSILLEPRRWNFNLFSGGSSITTVEVAAGRKKK